MRNFKELKDMILFSVGSDTLSSKLDTIIALAETDIANELIHVPQLLQSATLTTSEQYNTVVGVHLIKEVFIDGYQIQYKSILPKGISTGEPDSYSVEGRDTIKFDCKPDREYQLEVIYFPVLSPLLLGLTVADTDTNWLLLNAPNIYLYGSLSVATTLLNSDEAVKWGTLYKKAIKEYKSNLTVAGGIYNVME
jgi:hypothetical protein